MGRRNDHTREELKALLLDSARRVVEQKGANALTARAVTQEAGYAVGTLYNVFGSLYEVILHLNGETLRALAEQLEHAVNTRRGSLGRAIGGCYVGFARTHLPFWTLLFQHPATTSSCLPDWYQQRVEATFAPLERGIAEELPEAGAEVVRRAGRVLWAGLHGICMLSLSGKLTTTGSEAPEELTELLFDNHLRGELSR